MRRLSASAGAGVCIFLLAIQVGDREGDHLIDLPVAVGPFVAKGHTCDRDPPGASIVNVEGLADTVRLPGDESTMNVALDGSDQDLFVGVTLYRIDGGRRPDGSPPRRRAILGMEPNDRPGGVVMDRGGW